jgi:hypothetical protein
MNNREELIAKLIECLFQNNIALVPIKTPMLPGQIEGLLADFITEQTRLARVDELERIGTHDTHDKPIYTLTDRTKAGHQSVITVAERMAQLAPKPEKGPEHE